MKNDNALKFIVLGIVLEALMTTIFLVRLSSYGNIYEFDNWYGILYEDIFMAPYLYLNMPVTFMIVDDNFSFSLRRFWTDGLAMFNVSSLLIGAIYGWIASITVSKIQKRLHKDTTSPKPRLKTFPIYKITFIVLLVGIGVFGSVIVFKTTFDHIYCFRSSQLRIGAAESLVQKGDKIIPYLKREYENRNDISEKCGIIYVLGKIGGSDSLDMVMKAIKDADPDIRLTAVTAIENLAQSNNKNKRLETEWPIRKNNISALIELLSDENKGWPFPFNSLWANSVVQVRYTARECIHEFLRFEDEYIKSIYKIEGASLNFDTDEKISLALDFTRNFWFENKPYLYWINSETGVYDKKLIINQCAKLLGIPVDEITGKMIDVKDKHPLTQEEIKQICEVKGRILPSIHDALSRLRKREVLYDDFIVIALEKIQIGMDSAKIFDILGKYTGGSWSNHNNESWEWESPSAMLKIHCVQGKVTGYWIYDKQSSEDDKNK